MQENDLPDDHQSESDNIQLGVVPVNVTIYKIGENVPISKWSSELAVHMADHDLTAFKTSCMRRLNLREKCKQLGVESFNIEIANRSFKATPLFKDGRVFLVDSQES